MISKNWTRPILPILILLMLPALSLAQISVNISVNTPPPELPVYDQPPIPDDGYLWTPGYWAWDDNSQGYYWVPGTWVPAPQPDYLWTPGYWSAEGVAFLWHAGYWGPHVGFYGGVNYGYGYGGSGFEGGYWQGGHLYYNRAITNIGSVHVTNVYNKTVINNVTVNRVSFNGGNGGIRAQPNAAEQAAARDHHIAETQVQSQHIQAARSNPALRASANHGHPTIAATARPGAFSGTGVVAARQAGTANAVHSTAKPRVNPPPQTHAEQRPAQPPHETPPRATAPAAPRALPREGENQSRPAPAVVQRSRQAEPAARPARPPQPHPAEHPPEHEEDHEHH